MSDETRKLIKEFGEKEEESGIKHVERNTRGRRLDSGWLDERVVFLREMKGMMFKSIGKELGITTAAASSRYTRVKQRKELEWE